MSLQGRTAVVTGGAGGIGLAIVRRYLEEGARVAFFSRSEDKVERALESLQDSHGAGQVLGARADAMDPALVQAFVDEVRRRWGGLDILVNNAGASRRKDGESPWIEEISLEEWHHIVDANLTTAFICTRAAYGAMVGREAGRVINISSLAGRGVPQIAGPHYAAAKAGVIGLTKGLARDLAPRGITVNCLAPGLILTDMTGPAESPTNRVAIARIPLGHPGQPQDVAGIAAFLASRDSQFITGAVIDVSGGELSV